MAREKMNFDELWPGADAATKANKVQQYMPPVVGDVFEGQVYNGQDWLPQGEAGGREATYDIATGAMGAAVSGATPDTLLHGVQKGDSEYSASLKAQADESKEQEARAQADAQRGYQVASRDARVEADKDAATRASAAFAQRVKQQSAASGAGAAALASMNVQDAGATLAEHRARSDAQHLVAAQHAATAEGAAQDVIAKRASAAEANRAETDLSRRNTAAASLSKADKESSTLLGQYSLPELQDYVDQRAGKAPTRGTSQERLQALSDLVGSGQVPYDTIAAEIAKMQRVPSDERVKRILAAVDRRF